MKILFYLRYVNIILKTKTHIIKEKKKKVWWYTATEKYNQPEAPYAPIQTGFQEVWSRDRLPAAIPGVEERTEKLVYTQNILGGSSPGTSLDGFSNPTFMKVKFPRNILVGIIGCTTLYTGGFTQLWMTSPWQAAIVFHYLWLNSW